MPLLTYRTGAFAGSGIPIADGMHDYLDDAERARRRHRRGARSRSRSARPATTPRKGSSATRATKGKGALVYNPYSTGITLQLIPKASVDKIPVLAMAYGLSAAAVGKDFPWIFNPPGDLLGRRCPRSSNTSASRKAAGSRSCRARRSASSISMPATAASRSRCSSSWPRTTASSSPSTRCRPTRCRTSPRSGSTCAATGPTTWSCGAGGR